MASLDPVEPTVGSKRKNASALEEEESIRPVHKRLRSSEIDSLGPQSITNTLVSQAEHGAVSVVGNGQHAASKTDCEKVNGYRDSPVAETTGPQSLQDGDDALDMASETAACTGVFAPPTCLTPAGHLQCSSEALLTADGDEPALSPHSGAPGPSEAEADFRQVKCSPEVLNTHCSLDSNQSLQTNEAIYLTEINTPSPEHNEQTERTEQKSLTAGVTTKDTGGIKSETEDLFSATTTESEEHVPVPDQLFWRNSDNLCWLDSLLVALVNCKSLRKCKPKDEPQQSSVWQLMRGYEDVCAAVQVHQQTGRGKLNRSTVCLECNVMSAVCVVFLFCSIASTEG